MSAAPLLPPDWPAPPNVRAFTTLRRGGGVGVSQAPFDDFNLGAACGDDAGAVAANRAALIELGALTSAPHWLRQVHDVHVVHFDTPRPSDLTALLPRPPERERAGERARIPAQPPQADASITSTPNTVLAILTADCLPVLFTANDGSKIAAAHAGWRGLAAGVLEATVAAMHTPAANLIAWLGPAAGPAAYEVGSEVRDTFLAQDPAAHRHFRATRPNHWHADLYGLARDRLAALGIDRVFGGDHCTISEPQRFFSHRRDTRSGRMATLIWMQP